MHKQSPFQIGWRKLFVKLEDGQPIKSAIITYAKSAYTERTVGKLTIKLYRHTVFIDLWLISLVFNRYEK